MDNSIKDLVATLGKSGAQEKVVLQIIDIAKRAMEAEAERDELKEIGQRLMGTVAAMRVLLEEWKTFAQLKPRDENFISINLANTKKLLKDTDAGTTMVEEFGRLVQENEQLTIDVMMFVKKLEQAKAREAQLTEALKKINMHPATSIYASCVATEALSNVGLAYAERINKLEALAEIVKEYHYGSQTAAVCQALEDALAALEAKNE